MTDSPLLSARRATTRAVVHPSPTRAAVGVTVAALLATFFAPTPATAQAPQTGLRIVSPILSNDTLLVDEASQVVHTWQSNYLPGVAVYLDHDGNLLRLHHYGNGGIERIAFDGTVLWDWNLNQPGTLVHHDLEVLPNGNVLVIVYDQLTHAEAVAAGRNPALIEGTEIYPEKIVEVQQTGLTTGTVVWEWRMRDHLIQDFDPAQANYGVVADHPELIDVNYPVIAPGNGDWIHMNSVRYDPHHDWIILGARNAGELWIIDHSTTTAEAAGHTGGAHGKGGDLLYRWGNPEAYRAGTPLDRQLTGAHCINPIPPGYPGEGRLLAFDNRWMSNQSRVIEIELPLDVNGQFILDSSGVYGPAAPSWVFTEPGFYSPITSSAERLPNGNTLIVSGTQNRVFEVTPLGTTVWDHVVPFQTLFHAHLVERSLWTDTKEISLATGGTATYDMVAGSNRGNDVYLMLGSASGTEIGFSLGSAILPLNFDGYFLAMLQLPNMYPWNNTQSVLDANGVNQATISFPGGILPIELVGYRFDHAYFTLEPSNGALTWVSNAAGFTFVP